MSSYSALSAATFSILLSCFQATLQALSFRPVPSGLGRAKSRTSDDVPGRAREGGGVGGEKKIIGHFVRRIIKTDSSLILKVGYLERLNDQSLIVLGEMNSVLPLGLPWVQNRSVEKVGTSFSLLPVTTEGRATGFYFCDAPNLGIYHFLVASCLLFLCKNTRGKPKWHNHRIRSGNESQVE